MATVPVWVWLPGQDTPTHAGDLLPGAQARFIYLPEYLAREDRVSLDPVELPLTRSKRGIALRGTDGLPGVLRDAKPAGYGADRLVAQAGGTLEPLELLERGVPDAVGAMEACQDIGAKLAWAPRSLDELQALVEELDAQAPASRAMRKLGDDLDTSAGGERPKATITHGGALWLAKMQSRGDRVAMPAREFVTMRLARMVGLDAAEVDLKTFGSHQVLLVKRFDRAGDPHKPMRHLFASAHTAMGLTVGSTPGDPARSYLNLGDSLRVWARGNDDLPEQLAELWRRMAFNCLVGNTDDHPLNHGLLRDGAGRTGWRLSPAFDITPALSRTPQPIQDGLVLLMSTGADNQARANRERLIAAAGHFGVSDAAAAEWLAKASACIAKNWEPMLREAAAPVLGEEQMERLIAEASAAFAYSTWLAGAG